MGIMSLCFLQMGKSNTHGGLILASTLVFGDTFILLLRYQDFEHGDGIVHVFVMGLGSILKACQPVQINFNGNYHKTI